MTRTNFWARLDERQRAAVVTAAQTRRYPAGAVLLREGERARSAMVICSGRVKIVVGTPSGHTAVLALRGPGDIIGEIAAIDEDTRSATAISLDPVRVLWLPATGFDRLLHGEPGIAAILLKIVLGKLRGANSRRVERGDQRTLARLAGMLTDLAEDHGEHTPDGVVISIHISQADLAGLIGASRESVVLALKSLRDNGIIDTGRQRVVVLDPHRLREARDA
ncbi:CRP-like cAMP-binding protein [Herbihabitans rhizosphaerae]|uniref:CRP-like cAMP-binding protein n=1 Tax=Herbihabitans rhizosphaerae TaxID=1872711 RepID=A0A4Q7KVP3_9PSEU|nr:Crp/Fnr family transcriptional regulator [Herbihabitans rhizosphaerae]RZS41118.1 CRP-like cAMP-binding protein [Herbihabitans rhizosphaerae]